MSTPLPPKRRDSAKRRALLFGADPGLDAVRSINRAMFMLALVTAFGVIGYMMLGLGPVQAVYQTVMTLLTVGFGEVVHPTRPFMLFTIALMVLGVGVVLYNLGVLLESITDGHLRDYLGRRRMQNKISQLRNHVIICGYGRVGKAAAERLLEMGTKIVVLDNDPHLVEGLELPHVIGDPTLDTDVFEAAGIAHARAMICCLQSDAETVYATLSARALRPDLVIISRGRTLDAKNKLVLAGATRAVNPQLLGGRRMAQFALNADVAEFLDSVMHDDLDFAIEQIKVRPGCQLVGMTVRQIDTMGESQLLAVRLPNRGAFSPTLPATCNSKQAWCCWCSAATTRCSRSTRSAWRRPDRIGRSSARQRGW